MALSTIPTRALTEQGINFRNRLINGDMSVAQRGTSSSSNGYVSLDRWYVNQSGGSTTFSQETNSNPSETGGLQKYARLNVSSSSDYTGIRQPIEDVTSVPEGPITISFYAKGTAPTGGLYVSATQHFGSGGPVDAQVNTQITSSLTSSWVRYSAQLTLPSIDGKTIGAGSYLSIFIGQYSNSSSTAYDLNITGVQAEVGTTASDFELIHYDVNLQRCYRYYQQYGASGENLHLVGVQNATIAAARCGATLIAPTRANPSITTSGNLGLYNGVDVRSEAPNSIRSSRFALDMDVNWSSAMGAQGYAILGYIGANCTIKVDSEL